MSEYEYYTNSPYVNYCKWKGYEEKIQEEDIKTGFASWMLHRSLVTKPLSFKKYWPFLKDNDKSNETFIMTPDVLKAIKKAHNLK